MGLFGFLALLFVVVPIVEIMVLIELGQAVGLWPTLLVVLSTGIGGAMLARAEGMRAFLRFQGELASGQMPGQSIFDGISVLIGGILLLTPGLLTDLFGFSLLVPITRRWIQRRAQVRLGRMAAEGTIQIVNVGPPPGWAQARPDEDIDAHPPLDPSNEIAIEAQPGGGA